MGRYKSSKEVWKMIQIIEKQNHHFEPQRHNSVLKSNFMQKTCGYDDTVSTYSDIRPLCITRPKESRRASIKEVLSNTMFSVLSRSQGESYYEKEQKEKVHVPKAHISLYSRRSSRRPIRTQNRSAGLRDYRMGSSITDSVKLKDHSGDQFITDCLTGCKSGMRKDLPGATLQRRTCSFPAQLNQAKIDQSDRSKSID